MNDETLTPFIAWGAGIKKYAHLNEAQFNELLHNFDEFSGSIYKVDVGQADLAPLMSILVGNNIPTNSVGMLPFSLLDLHPKQVQYITFSWL